MSMWGGFAIFAATAWERMPRWSRLSGVCGVLAVGLVAGFIAWRLPELLQNADGHWGPTAARSTAWRTLMTIFRSPPGLGFARCSSRSAWR